MRRHISAMRRDGDGDGDALYRSDGVTMTATATK
jgi:hypothetical protein